MPSNNPLPTAAGSGSGAVDSVNGATGTVVLDPDDLSDAATTNKFATAAELTKLAGIEASATADQTGAEIKAAYELESNAFTDAQFTKLSNIETAATADQTGAEIKTAYESQADTNAYTDAAVTALAAATTNPRTAVTIFEAALSSSAQNCNGTQGSTQDYTWTATTNDASAITSFTGGDSEVVLTAAGEYVVDTSLIVLNSAANNRLIVLGTLRHLNSSDTELFAHQLGAAYIRDDNAGYDSAGLGGQYTVFAAAGDKIVLRTTVLDTGDAGAGSCPADQSTTILRIRQID